MLIIQKHCKSWKFKYLLVVDHAHLDNHLVVVVVATAQAYLVLEAYMMLVGVVVREGPVDHVQAHASSEE